MVYLLFGERESRKGGVGRSRFAASKVGKMGQKGDKKHVVILLPLPRLPWGVGGWDKLRFPNNPESICACIQPSQVNSPQYGKIGAQAYPNKATLNRFVDGSDSRKYFLFTRAGPL